MSSAERLTYSREVHALPLGRYGRPGPLPESVSQHHRKPIEGSRLLGDEIDMQTSANWKRRRPPARGSCFFPLIWAAVVWQW